MGNYFEFFKSVFLDEISDKFLIFKRMDAMTLFYTVNKIKSNQKDFFRAAPSLFEAVDLGLCFFVTTCLITVIWGPYLSQLKNKK